MNKPKTLRQYNWKIFLLRILVHALALSLTVMILPKLYYKEITLITVLVATLGLGVLNALVRPLLELLTFRLLFVSYGLVLVAINTIILYLLAFLLPNRFSVDGLFWAFVGGLLIGVIGNFLENLFGITRPILPDEAKELRKQIEAQDVGLLEAWINERKEARKKAQEGELAKLPSEPETAGEPRPAGQLTAAAGTETTPRAEKEVEAEETRPEEAETVTGGEA